MKRITYVFLTLLLAFTGWLGHAQINEDFESYNAGDVPTGWTVYTTETDDPGFIITTNRAHSGTKALYHNDDNINNVSTSWIVAPAYTSTGNDLLKFYYNQNYTSFSYNYSGVWYSTTGSDPTQNPGDWTEIAEFSDTGAGYSEDTWSQYMHTFNLSAGTTIYVAFKYTGDYDHEFYIDDFSLAVAPACMDPSSLSATALSQTEAQLSWTENGTATQWQIEYGPSGFTQGSGTVVNVTSNPYTLSGLTGGTDYEFYVRSDCGSGTYSNWVGPQAWHQPGPGESCSTAIAMNVESDCSTATPTTIDFSTATTDYQSGCDAIGTNHGYWYSITAPTSGKIKVSNSGSGIGLVILDNCGGSEVYCNNNNLADGEIISGLTAGSTYYLYFWRDSQSGTADICIEEATYTNPVFTLTAVPDCNNNQFNVDVEVTDLGGASSVTVSDDQGSPTQQLTSTGTVTFGPYTAGTNVTFTVTNDADATYSSTDNIQFFCPPANDDCSGAVALTVTQSCTPTTATNQGATDSGVPAPGCSNYQGGDVWFSVTVPSDGNVTIETSSVSGSNVTDTGMAVYEGSCGSLTEIACDDDGGSGFFSKIDISGRTAGEILYVRVFEYGNNSFGDFNICAYNPNMAVNDLSAQDFSFYPNPTSNSISWNANGQVEKVQITDLAGQTVLEIENPTVHTLNISKLTKGVYILHVLMDGKQGTYKLVKE